MSLLWLPERSEPLVSPEAEETVVTKLLHEGVAPLSAVGLNTIHHYQERVGFYLDELGFDLNNRSAESWWPDKTLKIGAAIAMLAYRETGYFQVVDEEIIAEGQSKAVKEGIPIAYSSRLHEDGHLASIMDTVLCAKDFEAPNPEGYRQVLDIGAGCVRFYMEQALAA